MEGLESLLSAIDQQATQEVEAIRQGALAYADQKKEETQAALEAYRAELERKAVQSKEELCAKRRIDAQLEARKILLDAKREILASVYRKVLDKLDGLDYKSTLALIESLLDKYAQKGDTVRLAADGRAELYEVSLLPVVKKKGLKVVADKSVSSGFVLDGNGFDRDLSYEALVKELQEETEMALSKRLFD